MEATHFGAINVTCGWIWMILGILSGSVIGMWSFGGPVPLPKGYESYASLPRRLTRLAHIAMFALPMISILYGMTIDSLAITDQLKVIGCYSFLVCMVGVPTLLIAASFYLPFKYLEVIPVSAGILGLGIQCWGNLQKLL